MLSIRSTEFLNNGKIPRKYTCDGDDVSPPLGWSGAPPGTKSLVLVVDDPDAPDPAHPRTRWVHWLLFNLPPGLRGLPANVAMLPPGTGRGLNDWDRFEYGGPCPPVGRHRYFFKLYALDCERLSLERPRLAQLERAMQGHILATAELIGTYQKSS